MKKEIKLNKQVLVLAVATALTGEAYAVEKPDNLDELSPDLQEIWDKMDRVDREDMRVKSGEVDGDTMTLRVEDMAESRGRDEVFGRDVDIDVSDLNQADEVADLNNRVDATNRSVEINRNNITTNTTLIGEVSNAVINNTNKINTNTVDISNVDSRVDETNRSVEINRNNIRTNTTLIGQTNDLIGQVADAVNNNTVDIRNLDSRVTTLENAPDFGDEITDNYNVMGLTNNDILQYESTITVEDEDGNVTEHTSGGSVSLQRFNQQAEVDALDGRVTENESEIDRLTDKTNRHTDRLNNQSDRLETQKERLNNQSERISNLRDDMQRNDARIEAKADQNAADIEALDGRVTQNESDIAQNASDIATNSAEIVRVENESIARDEALQDNIDAVDAASRKRDKKQNKKIRRNTRAIEANSAAIAVNSAEISRVEDESIARDQALAAGIASNSAAIAVNAAEIDRVEDESIRRDEAIMDYVIEDQARQDALIADNAAEIDRVEEQSVERDEALADLIDQRDLESIVRDIHLHQRVEREETERALQDDLLREDINKNHQRIVDTNRRIDLAEDRIYQNEMHIDNLYQNMDHLRSDMYSAVAGAAAMAAIPDAPVGRTAIGIGYGNFSGQDAAAFGISHRTESGKHAFTLSGTFTQRDNGVSAGYSYSF